MANKHADTLKAKQKKQKIIAAVLGVLFVGVLVFQVPRLMKQLHPAAAPTPTAPAHPSSASRTSPAVLVTPATDAKPASAVCTAQSPACPGGG